MKTKMIGNSTKLITEMIEYNIKHIPVFCNTDEVMLQCSAIDGEYYSQINNTVQVAQMYTHEYYFLLTGMLHYVTNQINVFKTRK